MSNGCSMKVIPDFLTYGCSYNMSTAVYMALLNGDTNTFSKFISFKRLPCWRLIKWPSGSFKRLSWRFGYFLKSQKARWYCSILAARRLFSIGWSSLCFLLSLYFSISLVCSYFSRWPRDTPALMKINYDFDKTEFLSCNVPYFE